MRLSVFVCSFFWLDNDTKFPKSFILTCQTNNTNDMSNRQYFFFHHTPVIFNWIRDLEMVRNWIWQTFRNQCRLIKFRLSDVNEWQIDFTFHSEKEPNNLIHLVQSCFFIVWINFEESYYQVIFAISAKHQQRNIHFQQIK